MGFWDASSAGFQAGTRILNEQTPSHSNRAGPGRLREAEQEGPRAPSVRYVLSALTAVGLASVWRWVSCHPGLLGGPPSALCSPDSGAGFVWCTWCGLPATASLALTMATMPAQCCSQLLCPRPQEEGQGDISGPLAGERVSSGSGVRATVGWPASRSPFAHGGHPTTAWCACLGGQYQSGLFLLVAHTILAQKPGAVVWPYDQGATQRASGSSRSRSEMSPLRAARPDDIANSHHFLLEDQSCTMQTRNPAPSETEAFSSAGW